jgi:hypothetical protein
MKRYPETPSPPPRAIAGNRAHDKIAYEWMCYHETACDSARALAHRNGTSYAKAPDGRGAIKTPATPRGPIHVSTGFNYAHR